MMYIKNSIHPMLLGFALSFLGVCANAATVISDFSTFSETGNLLGGSNDREQDFTPSGSNLTITYTSGGGVGQEAFLSDAFPTLTTGHRISVDRGGLTNFDLSSESVGLAVASTEMLGSRVNLITWGWRPQNNDLSLRIFDGSGGTDVLTVNVGSSDPDTLFIDRTAVGWSFGSIAGGVETIHYTDLTTVGSTSITADGSAFGIWSDMRDSDAGGWTVSNLTIIPEPSAVMLLGMGGVMVLLCRRR